MDVKDEKVDSENSKTNGSSLYIGNVHPDVTEVMLYEKFSKVGPLYSIRICRDRVTRESLGYAYVNYQHKEDAERALHTMNFDTLEGCSMRIMWCQRDPSKRQSGIGNVFIKNLDSRIDDQALFNIFSSHGDVISSKVATNYDNVSKGYGFVQFEDDDSSKKAIRKLNGMILNGKKISVTEFVPKSARTTHKPNEFTNIFVKNFPEEWNDEDLVEHFEKHGTINSAKVMRDEKGLSKCFGFVDFAKPENAVNAIQDLNGEKVKDKALFVGKAQKREERQTITHRCKNNVFVKNLPDDIDDAKLNILFAGQGLLSSVKVMTDEDGKSRRFGFVNFLHEEDAEKAINSMNGKYINGNILFVSLSKIP